MPCPHCGWSSGQASDRASEERYCAGCGAALRPARDANECAVVISFDVDGASGMINRDPGVEHRPSARSFGDYGPSVAVPHILALLAERGVPASFYVPGWIAERNPSVVERIAAAGHEIGHHGYLHEPPASLSAEQEAEVLERGSEILRGIVGEAPAGYRSPSWELSDHSLGLLRERGFRYDSSLMGGDAPYWAAEGLVELPIHWALDDYPYFVFAPTDGRRLMAAPEHVYAAWRDAFDELYSRGGVFTLTMHPYIIGRPGRLRMLDRLLDHIQRHPNAAFRRAIDLVDEFAAARPWGGG